MTVLMGVVGPAVHGLDPEDDEPKVLGVYLADAEDVCGLHGPAALARTYVSPGGDLTMHELHKFATLALEADPAASELLWLGSHTVCTEAGHALVELREAFLSAPCVRKAYGGAALRLFRRPSPPADEDAELITAYARDCLRLLRQGRALLTSGHLITDMTAQREDVLAAAELATRNPKAFSAVIRTELAALDSIDSVLPGRPDTARVNATLIELRLASLRQAAP
ncbi:DNA polymerase beta superfamily protein [Nonomuraea sp. NPDC059023]|uniref:DNA polymerase beta superfamily protein n=1 Tax=unclassified Nonomuraea TaxID=2593643 RepID=UPI003696B062